MSADKKQAFAAIWCAYAPGLPDPAPEHRFGAAIVGGPGKGLRARLALAGLRDWRFDWAWINERVAVEVDGGAWMPFGGRHAHDDDRRKLNAAAERGWLVLRYSPQMIDRDPLGVVRQVAETLSRARGLRHE